MAGNKTRGGGAAAGGEMMGESLGGVRGFPHVKAVQGRTVKDIDEMHRKKSGRLDWHSVRFALAFVPPARAAIELTFARRPAKAGLGLGIRLFLA